MHDGEVDSTLFLSSDEALPHLSGYVNSRNNKYWGAEHPVFIHKLSSYDGKIGVWCAAIAPVIIGQFFLRL
jgi:hypothetical protein